MTAEPASLRVSTAGGRLDVVIDRPHARNALNVGTLEKMAAIFQEHADDRRLRVAVISGAEDKAFAAGGDLKELNSWRSPEDAAALFDLGRRATEAVRRFPVPVVAALNGIALGGGAELAISCDFRLASRHARIGFVQAQLALTTGFGGMASLQGVVGHRRALHMLLKGDVLTAEQALRLGIVDAVAAQDQPLGDLVSDFIAPILMRPAELVRDLKAIALAGEDFAARESVTRIERERFIRAWTSPEHWMAAEQVLSRSR